MLYYICNKKIVVKKNFKKVKKILDLLKYICYNISVIKIKRLLQKRVL
jgi:hypothetical protein